MNVLNKEYYGKNAEDFIDDEKIWNEIKEGENADKSEIREIIAKSKSKVRLNPDETAKLIGVNDDELLDEMFKAAREIKEDVYGKRIVFFAPLYVGNKCMNNCVYCGFRRDNKSIVRKTLTMDELKEEVRILESKGQKRLILVYG